MKRRWRLVVAAGASLTALILLPVGYIEGTCRAPIPDALVGRAYAPLLPAADRRARANSYLTYPEWHVVYEADAFARHLAAGRPPSSFGFGRQISEFWTSYCTVNRLTRADPAASDYKITIYTIGISFTVELAIKAAYERTIGRLFEWSSGWSSADDAYAADVQRRYGAFLHETPWYRFPFGEALRREWRTTEPHLHARHWERRLALSSEFGVKALYAKAIDAATGATVGRDELTLRFVAQGDPAAVRAVDPQLHVVGSLRDGRTIVEAPRYQAFNDLLAKLAATPIGLVEIAGNDTIFLTMLLPPNALPPERPLLSMPVDRPGWRRVGIAVPVPALLATLRKTWASGGIVEHVYDY